MDILSWISILTIIVLCVSLTSVIKDAKKIQSAYLVLLSLGMVSYLISNLVYVIPIEYKELIKWFNLLTLSCILSALFGLIRDSKPIFARFPIYLIYLPFIIIFFFPLISNQIVLTNLLLGMIQAGCIIVALMMFTLHQIKSGSYIWEICSVVSFTAAYIIFWFVRIDIGTQLIIAEILITFGIALISIGIYKSYKSTIHEEIA